MEAVDFGQERDNVIEGFLRNRRKTEELCAPLGVEDYLMSVTEDTSPPKWHLAHTSWFLENFILKKFQPGYEPHHPEFSFLFNSYYKTIGSYLPKLKRNILSRPSLEEVYNYRKRMTKAVKDLVEKTDSETYQKIRTILEIGIHHEYQHQELLLMDIKRSFFESPLKPLYQNTLPDHHEKEFSEATWLEIPEDLYRVGVSKYSSGFSYDNEGDGHFVWIDRFLLSSHLVTNDDYLAFMEDGGYENPKFWLSDGWDLKEREGWNHPLYWIKEGQDYWTMTLSGLRPLDLAAPVVHVSYYEAQAFAHWRNCRLPTEFEWV
jgi:ergothioneine biosynthesis protein EgtB